jgi:hypothetical protein
MYMHMLVSLILNDPYSKNVCANPNLVSIDAGGNPKAEYHMGI